MFLALFVIFLVFWLLGFLAFHIAGGFICNGPQKLDTKMAFS